jgi:ribosome biogenesis GTPase
MPNFLNELNNALIRKAIAGFYYVEAGEALLPCKARGLFRKQGISPLVGDRVRVSVSGDSGWVEEISTRKNSLVRPPLANLDKLFIVASVDAPPPDLRLLDKLTVICETKNIEPLLVFSKTDLGDASALLTTYRKAGFFAVSVQQGTDEGLTSIKAQLGGFVCAFCGNSGVGKTSLLSALCPELELETGAVSEKLGRGRHTTRETQLFEAFGGYIADTPGFSSLDLIRYEPVAKEALPGLFRDFDTFSGHCRFSSCAHVREKGCAVREAVDQGEIAKSRYESYLALYEDVKDWKEWQNT